MQGVWNVKGQDLGHSGVVHSQSDAVGGADYLKHFGHFRLKTALY